MFVKFPASRLLSIMAIMLVGALVLAACDDADDDTVDDAPTPTEQVTDDDTATPQDTAEPEPTETATEEEPEETPAATPTPFATTDDDEDDEDENDQANVLVHMVRGEEIGVAARSIAPTQQVATAAINELLTGTTAFEEDIGLHTEIPEATRLLDISLNDGILTVDLSGDFEAGGGSASMTMRVAQVVFTATQFESVDAVQFRIDGNQVEAIGGEGVMVDQPLTREDFEDQSPIILLESPAPGEVVTSPVRLQGTSNTFEATLQIELVDNSGEIIFEDHAMATSGTGTRGTFDVEVPFELNREGFGSIILFEYSARDGSRVNIVEIPVDFRNS